MKAKSSWRRGHFIWALPLNCLLTVQSGEPYAVWLQGGLTYFTGKTGILLAAQTMLEDGVLSLEN